MFDPYLPTLANLLDLGLAWLVLLILLFAGTGIAGRKAPVAVRIGAGWGALCLVLTAWGVLVPISLVAPAAIFMLASAALILLPDRRPSQADGTALGRMAVVSLPLALVMAPIRPAEPDTWLNLLPNAVYLVDYGRLPAAFLPPSHSFLPAAPYNTQFLSYLGALLDPDFPAPGMSLMNMLLLLTAGMLMAGSLAGRDRRPGWGLTALGLLLATLLNPGFAPRIHLAAYGETGLAVTALMAGWLYAEAQGAHAEGRRNPGLLVPLALVLAAMAEIKQSGFGLVAASAGAGMLAGFAERGIPWRRTFAFAGKSVVPAVLLCLLWRTYVAFAGVDELKPLPFAQWQWTNIPAILASMLHTVLDKGVYFGAVALALILLPVLLRRQGWNFATRLLAFHAALFLLYGGFLLLTYIVHFPGAWSTEAHSFFRYETHLSLVLMASLAAAAHALLPGTWWEGKRGRAFAGAAIVLAIAAPLGFAPMLRFDLVMPQPLAWQSAENLAPYLKDGDRLALLLPGDNGSVATMLEGILADTEPRRRDLDIMRADRADMATLDAAAKAGYRLAFVSCTPEGLGDAPPNQAVLLRRDTETWRPVAVWSYGARTMSMRWQHILSWQPFCRKS